MRWVVAHPGPDWSVADVCAGWVEALTELGQDVHLYDLATRLAFYDHTWIDIDDVTTDGPQRFRKALDSDGARDLAVNGLAAALFKIRPHVLLVICGFLLPAELLEQARRYGTRVVTVHTEEPYEVERELALAAHADLNLINDPTHIERFREVAPTLYCPQAYRPGFHEPGPADPVLAADLAFVGTGFGSRRWFFEQMDLTGLDVLLAGNWKGTSEDSPIRRHLGHELEECVDNDQTVAVYRSAKAGINLYRRETDADHPGQTVGGWACGPREIEMAASGLFFLRDPRPEGDALFHMLPTFAGPDEASEVLRWWLGHPEAREKAAQQAREAVADRTFGNHAQALLRLLETKE